MVAEILQRPYFKNAVVLAGHEGLNKTVQWAHVMEVTEIGELLNGNELILSTGMAWHHDENLSVSFLQQLIDKKAAALCIEFFRYSISLPKKMIDLANDNHFPIIAFHEEVRFVDITRDLHSMLVNRQHKILEDLDHLSQKLNKILLSGNGLSSLLQMLHSVTKAQVAYLPVQEDPEFFPPMTKDKRTSFFEEWKKGEHTLQTNEKGIECRPIYVLNHRFAELVIYSPGRKMTRFETFALDRCSTAVAQELMRTLYMEEKRLNDEHAWIHSWISGELDAEQIRDHLVSINPTILLKEAAVCIFDTGESLCKIKDIDRFLIQKTIVARSIFEQEGFFLVPTVTKFQIVYILINQRHEQVRIENRLLAAIKRLQQAELKGIHVFSTLFAVGQTITDLQAIEHSFNSAKETLSIQKKIGSIDPPTHHQLHVYRVISLMEQSNQIHSWIDEYLGPLLQYDKQKNGRLLHTLKVYLNYSGAKKETAKDLFIVRQTLYHRLEKIYELLGDDLMEAKKRTAIELAIFSYEYLYGPINERTKAKVLH